jgi:serine phosphatase RsbU (regulator of sigma subunit)
MARIDLLKSNEVEQNLADVLYLSSSDKIPPEIEQLCEQKNLTYKLLSLAKYPEIKDKLDFIGTAIIDTKNTNDSRQIIQIIESLEANNISVILLTDKSNSHTGGFTPPPGKTGLCIGTNSQGILINELEAKISLNLASRKSKNQNSNTGAPYGEQKQTLTGLPENQKQEFRTTNKKSVQTQTIYRNKLAEQLNMTKTLADNLAEQLRLAGLVQQDFLPSKLPNTDKLHWSTVFLPAEWVSGDIYDIARLDEEHIGFYVADVVGHGMPAALLTIFLKQALVMRETNGSSYRIFSPSDVMKNLNMRMSAQKLSGYQFATCCYCLLNTKTLLLTYARAGHPYPILIRDGKQPEQLEVRGSLLGIFEQAEFPQQTVQLQPKDKIVLYSDGVDSYVGNFNNKAGFTYRREFIEVSRMSVGDMMEGFDCLIKGQNVRESEIDDITILGLEVLP